MTRWDSDNLNAAHTKREFEQEWGCDGMSDLVKRLRDPRGHSPTSMDGFERDAVGFRDKMCTEAAARIEHLEREQKLDHENINIKADAIERWINTSAEQHCEIHLLKEELTAEKALADQLYEGSLGEICSDAAYVSYRKARGLLNANIA